ncbi:MAG: ORF6N domain-containing protein [Candidatus Woesearchaeota archaeon]
MSTTPLSTQSLKDKIHTIRGVQVMLDRDLAELYNVETRALKQAVNRNKERFPTDFMFALNEHEIEYMVSQSVIPSKQHLGGAKPFAFTEQGVANLASVLTSDKAIQMNIEIMRAFVEMRKFLANNAGIFQRLDKLELKQIEHDKNFEHVFEAIEDKQLQPQQGIFYNGQVFDAHKFASDLVRTAQHSIILIDNYVDDTTLSILAKRKKTIPATIYTKNITKQLKLDVKKHNEQYQAVQLKEFKDAHDRFLIIDNTTVYHIGASLKDIGKKWFAFSKMEKSAMEMIGKLE